MSNGSTSEKRLHGKVAVVTGASRGIGKACAIALAEQGASIAILSRSLRKLEELKEAINPLGVRCFADACDVADTNMLENFIRHSSEELGAISILINNAGIYATEPILDHSLQIWQQVLQINLTAAMWSCRSVLPQMIENRWGRIINISSISGKQGEAYGAAYSASKFGMIGLTQSMALEVARHGVTVNAVCPGWVETDMAIDQLQDDRWCDLNAIPAQDSVEIAKLSVPHGRFIQPA